MASGLPVVATDVPGIRELIRHGETGWLCGTDSAAIRAALVRVASDATLRAHLGAAARQQVVSEYSLDRIVNLELELLRSVVAEAKQRHR
jgi:glycosyltransferase involved in cell wall biosynthesis